MPEELHRKLEEEYKDLPKEEREHAVFGTMTKIEKKKMFRKHKGSVILSPGVIGKTKTVIEHTRPRVIGEMHPRSGKGHRH